MKKRLTKTQRRVAIVKDAIAQLKIGTYLTGDYGYVKLPESLQIVKSQSPDQSAQELLCDLAPSAPCGICAKGGLLLSIIRKENEFKIKNLVSDNVTAVKRLTVDNLFTAKNLFLMEAYYEGWVVHPVGCRNYLTGVGFGFTDKQLKEHQVKINKLKQKYPEGDNHERNERLLAVFRNMVRNGGIFKP